MEDLTTLREKIDDIDNKLSEIYLDRIELVKKVGEFKKNNNVNVLHQNREQEIIDRLSLGKTETEKNHITHLYKNIFNYSKMLQTQPKDIEGISVESFYDIVEDADKICCQGVNGAYSEIAAKSIFKDKDIVFVPTFKKVFEKIQNGECEFGVLPIENSTAGSVNEVYEGLNDFDLFIVDAVKLSIRHSLLVKKGTTKNNLTKIYSHIQGLSQCKNYIENLNVDCVSVLNTAMAAKMVSESNEHVAAIASCENAKIYGLEILENDISDNQNNFTRFIVISKKKILSKKSNRISLIITLQNRPNALCEMLNAIMGLNLQLLKIESRPKQNTDFEVVFYLDVEGNLNDEPVKKMLEVLKNYTESIKLCGEYFEK